MYTYNTKGALNITILIQQLFRKLNNDPCSSLQLCELLRFFPFYLLKQGDIKIGAYLTSLQRLRKIPCKLVCDQRLILFGYGPVHICYLQINLHVLSGCQSSLIIISGCQGLQGNILVRQLTAQIILLRICGICKTSRLHSALCKRKGLTSANQPKVTGFPDGILRSIPEIKYYLSVYHQEHSHCITIIQCTHLDLVLYAMGQRVRNDLSALLVIIVDVCTFHITINLRAHCAVIAMQLQTACTHTDDVACCAACHIFLRIL